MCIEIHVCKCIRGIHTQLVSTMCVILMMQAHQWPQTIPKTMDTICGTKSYSKKSFILFTPVHRNTNWFWLAILIAWTDQVSKSGTLPKVCLTLIFEIAFNWER